ncbi:MAG: hypothetical protein K0S09_47 [Sphingobacteriaceae bacterium]|jgi:hypothetical protein|nr:hypothetical protein [Sphingobacteriaceae bacterium]
MKTLLTDKYSTMKKGLLYGKKGDKVTVIETYHRAVIVEGKDGKRFSVKVEELI